MNPRTPMTMPGWPASVITEAEVSCGGYGLEPPVVKVMVECIVREDEGGGSS